MTGVFLVVWPPSCSASITDTLVSLFSDIIVSVAGGQVGGLFVYFGPRWSCSDLGLILLSCETLVNNRDWRFDHTAAHVVKSPITL